MSHSLCHDSAEVTTEWCLTHKCTENKIWHYDRINSGQSCGCVTAWMSTVLTFLTLNVRFALSYSGQWVLGVLLKVTFVLTPLYIILSDSCCCDACFSALHLPPNLASWPNPASSCPVFFFCFPIGALRPDPVRDPLPLGIARAGLHQTHESP